MTDSKNTWNASCRNGVCTGTLLIRLLWDMKNGVIEQLLDQVHDQDQKQLFLGRLNPLSTSLKDQSLTTGYSAGFLGKL